MTRDIRCACASKILPEASEFLLKHCPAMKKGARPPEEDACSLASNYAALEDLEEAAHDFCRRHRATLDGFLGSVKQLWTSRNIASRNKTGKLLEDCLGKILASEGLALLDPERLIEVSRRLDGLYKP